MNKQKLRIISRCLLLGIVFLLFCLILMKQWTALWISLLILAVLIIVFGFALFEFALDPSCPFCMIRFSDYTSERSYPAFREAEAWFHSQEETLDIRAADGTRLNGTVLRHPDSHLWTICFHGYGNAAEDAMCVYAYGFWKMGCNILCPRARAHGKSGGKYVEMGWKSKDDVRDWIAAIKKQDPEAKFILFGISMGAAAAMMASGNHLGEDVLALVEDCGYSSVEDEYRFQLASLFCLPSFPVIPAASLACRVMTGSSFTGMSSVKMLETCTIPALFIHGKKDGFVPFSMLEKNVRACASPVKETLVLDEARHGESVYVDPIRYWSTIRKFLETNQILQTSQRE